MGRLQADDVNNQQLAPTKQLAGLLQQDNIKQRFTQIMGDNAPAFISSILSLANAKKELATCAPNSIIAAAAIAAALKLPVDPNLGFAALVPYGGVAQFQIQYKGFIQLAIRSGQYQRMNAFLLHEGELVSYNRITGDTVIDEAQKKSDKVIAYGFYFRLTTGFEHFTIMTKEQVEKHAQRYSKSYAKRFGPWKDNFDAMGLKTVIKLGLSKYGILSVEMQKAIKFDQGAVKGIGDDLVTYPDNAEDAILVSETKEEKKGE